MQRACRSALVASKAWETDMKRSMKNALRALAILALPLFPVAALPQAASAVVGEELGDLTEGIRDRPHVTLAPGARGRPGGATGGVG